MMTCTKAVEIGLSGLSVNNTAVFFMVVVALAFSCWSWTHAPPVGSESAIWCSD